jgi:branched-chain amino acid transport system substrate-binding protein
MKSTSGSLVTRRVFLAVLLSIVAACTGGCRGCKTDGAPARIGFLLPLGTETGAQARKGGELAIRDLNAEFAGTVHFEARWEDDRDEPATAGTGMEALATSADVLGVVGPVNSGPAIAAADVGNRRHISLVSPLASTPALAKPDDYFFRTWPSDASEGTFASGYVRTTLRLQRIVLLHVGAPYGQGLAHAFAADFRSHGGTILDTIEYPPDTQTFGALAKRVVDSSPQVLYFVGYPPDMAELLRVLRSRSPAFPVVSAAIVADPSVARLAGKNVEGVIFPFPATFDSGVVDAAMRRFATDYKAAYGQDPGFVAAQAYDATMLIGRAIGKGAHGSQLPSRESIMRTLSNTGQVQGTTGPFHFDANGDAVRQFRMYEIRGGRMVPRP